MVSSAPSTSRTNSLRMNVGMSMPTGQPAMQVGLTHWMQRSASRSASAIEYPRLTSLKLWMRSAGPLLHSHLFRLERRKFLVVAFAVDDQPLLDPADVIEVFVGECLLALDPPLARVELFEIDPRPSKSGSSTKANSTSRSTVTRHEPHYPRPMNHNRVERHDGLDTERPGGLNTGVHHRKWADGDHEIRMRARRPPEAWR